MLLFSIILLIVVGIILLVLEILVLPGLIAGIIGVIFMISGNLLMYKNYGITAGNITILCTVIITAILFYVALKAKVWSYFSLKDSNNSKVIDLHTTNLNVGDEGIAVSALRPMGTVMIAGQKVEAQTNGEFIDAQTKIVLTKVLSNKIIVSSLNSEK